MINELSLQTVILVVLLIAYSPIARAICVILVAKLVSPSFAIAVLPRLLPKNFKPTLFPQKSHSDYEGR